jgi:hypothetical protein
MIRFLVVLLVWAAPAHTMVGGAPEDASGSGAVLIVGSRGNSCTGVALAPALVLTAAHCVLPGADYKIVQFDAARRPVLKDVVQVLQHPQFSLQSLLAHRATADLAILRVAEPLPETVVPAMMADQETPVLPGERFIVSGYGVTVRGDGRSGGRLRSATLEATGRPGALQLRLQDPETRNALPGLGACTGDSGAPVIDARTRALVGVVSWSTGPNNAGGCGGLTGVTPLARYRGWINATMRSVSGAIQPLPPGRGGAREVEGVATSLRRYDAANFSSLMASKSCTPPPTRLVV